MISALLSWFFLRLLDKIIHLFRYLFLTIRVPPWNLNVLIKTLLTASTFTSLRRLNLLIHQQVWISLAVFHLSKRIFSLFLILNTLLFEILFLYCTFYNIIKKIPLIFADCPSPSYSSSRIYCKVLCFNNPPSSLSLDSISTLVSTFLMLIVSMVTAFLYCGYSVEEIKLDWLIKAFDIFLFSVVNDLSILKILFIFFIAIFGYPIKL